MDPFRNGAAGVVSSAKLLRPKDFAELTTIRLRAIALALRARLRRFRWLRNFYLMPQPPLLCEEGNTPHSTFLQFIHTLYDRPYFADSRNHGRPISAPTVAFQQFIRCSYDAA